MKKTKFFALAFAALALGACSSDDLVEQKNPTVTGGEKGYVSVAVNLPTQPTGRAAESFDDGLPAEYKVNDATLLLFVGTNEANATFASAYDLDETGFATSGTTTDQITSNATLVQEITRPQTTAGDKIYALVVLNNNGHINVSDLSASLDGTSLSGKTFKNFSEMVMTLNNGAAGFTGNGFFMSNAPLYSVAGGSAEPANGSVSTLAEINPAAIYTTEAEASSHPAANIYVERAVAKVTVNATDASSVTDGNPNLASYTVAGWTFNVANTKTYAVRNVANGGNWWTLKNENTTGVNQYRFVGNLPVATGLYRTYFGEDPNYSTYTSADFIVNSKEDLDNADLFGFGNANPGYCLENTFNVANQINNRTTQVVVKAKLTLKDGTAESDGSFYTLNGNTSTIYKKSGVVAEVQRRIMNWFDANSSTYIKSGNIQGTSLDVVLSNATTDEGGVITVTSVTLDNDDVKDVEWQDGQELSTLNAAIATQVAALNSDNGLKISYYKGGYAYYPILIKHFGDDQTPWASDNDASESYPGPSADANWLGRYGVLRNNWYDITVTGIKNIGSPSVPDVTEEYDDPENSYIAVSINVLSWAKRTQNAGL